MTTEQARRSGHRSDLSFASLTTAARAAGPTTLYIPPPSTAPPSSIRQKGSGNPNTSRFNLPQRRPVNVTMFSRYQGPTALVLPVGTTLMTPPPRMKNAPSAAGLAAPSRTTAAAAPKTTIAFPQPQQSHDLDSVDPASCLYLVKLHVGGNPSQPSHDHDAATSYWPCLAFSTYADAQPLHYELYPKQKDLAKKLLKGVRVELSQLPASNANKDNNKFKVVLPLYDASGCCLPSLLPFYDVDVSSAVGGMSLIGQFGKEFVDSKQNPQDKVRHAALMEMSRLLQLDAGEQGASLAGKRSREEQEATGQTFEFPTYKKSANETPRLAAAGAVADENTAGAIVPFHTSNPTPAPARQHAADFRTPVAAPATAPTTFSTVGTVQGKKTAQTGENIQAVREGTRASRSSSRNSTATSAKQRKKAPTKKSTPKAPFQTPRPAATSKSAKKGETIKFPRPSSIVKPSTSKKTPRPKEWKEQLDTIAIAPWREVKPLLELFGYTFHENCFSRPNGDPNQFPDAKEGEDYFTSLKSFRTFLCIHGVDSTGQLPWDKHSDSSKIDIDMIDDWVRYSIVATIRDATAARRKFPYYCMKPKTALDCLIDHQVVVLHNKYHWALPWATPPVKGEEVEILDYLGRHGIPAEFESKMEPQELIALQFYLAEKYAKNNKTIVKRPERYRKRQVSASSMHTPEASKDALEAATRAPATGDRDTPRDSLQPRQLMSEDESEKSQSDIVEPPRQDSSLTSLPQDDGPPKSPTKNSMEAAALEAREDAIKDAPMPQLKEKSGSPKDNGLKPAVAVDETESPRKEDTTKLPASNQRSSTNESQNSPVDTVEESVTIPGRNIGEKLKGCLDALRKASDDQIVASGNLSRAHDAIRKFLRAVIKSKGRKGGRSNSHAPMLYICGAPGTGKTMSTTHLCNEAIAEEEATLEDWQNPPRVCYINCTSLQNLAKKEALDKIESEMNVTSRQRGSDAESSFAVIVILDEVDTMFGSKGLEYAFETLSGWAQDEKSVVSLIGISNSVNNNKSHRMLEYGMGGNKIVFQPYRKDELVNITISKIGVEVVDKRAMEFVAAKVAASSGDARRYLELMTLAITRCRIGMTNEKLANPLTKPVVTMKEAMMAIRETITKYKDIVAGLTMLEKVTLCSGVHLARRFDGKEVALKYLKDLVMECFGIEYDLDIAEFKGVLERLQDSGVLILRDDDKRRLQQGMLTQELSRCPIRFDMQLEDVESALDETVMKEPFYQKLVERVKALKVNDM